MTAMENVSRNLDENTRYFVLPRETARGHYGRRRGPGSPHQCQYHGNHRCQRTGARNLLPMRPMIRRLRRSSVRKPRKLLEESQSSFQGISLDQPRAEEFAALKRPLHTLKGGARMAGVTAMGDLAHERESLIIGIELGNVPPSREARDALQRSLDALGQMRDLLAAGRPVAPVQGLLAQVRSLIGGEPLPEPLEQTPPPPPPAPVFQCDRTAGGHGIRADTHCRSARWLRHLLCPKYRPRRRPSGQRHSRSCSQQ